jgi:hypothetical protein
MTITGTPIASASAYSLEDARTTLKRITPWLTQDVSLEPVLGLTDGSNTVFHLPYTPVDADSSLTIYDADGGELDGYTMIGYDGGALRFSSGSVPTTTVYASYTAQAISNSKLLNVCRSGFDDMESRYRRDWRIVSVGGYSYISSSADSVVDPVCGSQTLSTSRVQIDFLNACCEYALTKALHTDAALRNYAYREERVGGLMVDRSRQADTFKTLLAEADKKADAKAAAARYEAGETSEWGSFIPGAQSDSYADGWEWWSTSKQARGG